MEYYSAIKKHEIMPFAATWMDLQIIILSEVSQRQISSDINYVWHLKYGPNELIYKTKKTHREQTCGFQGGGRVGERRGSLGLADTNYYM